MVKHANTLTFINWSKAFEASELPLNSVRGSPECVCVCVCPHECVCMCIHECMCSCGVYVCVHVQTFKMKLQTSITFIHKHKTGL